MYTILYSQINIFCIIILLLIFFKMKSDLFLSSNQRLFAMVLLSNCALFSLDLLWALCNNRSFELASSVNWLINCLYFILSGVFTLSWFFYSEDIQRSAFIKDRRHSFISAIPFILLTALSLVSLKTGWLFYIDAENVYHRGPLYLLQLPLTYGYIIFTAVKALHLSTHAENHSKRREYRTLSTFIFPALITAALQTLLPGVPVSCMGITLGVLYVYINLQEQLISVDPFTGLNNRSQMFQFLSSKMGHLNREKRLYLLMMDIDYFKRVNDQYGHLEGDRALCQVADALKHSCRSTDYFISRYGGDEFIVVCELGEDESVDDVCRRIHSAVSESSVGERYKLTVSIGCAEFAPDMKSYQDLIRVADEELYEIKRARGV